MKQAVTARLQAGRPVQFSAEEAAYLVETLRGAVATTLDLPAAEIADESRLYADLGMDSIDLFDVLDQLAQHLEVPMALEDLPESFLRGDAETTFRTLADGLLHHFRQPPPPPAPR